MMERRRSKRRNFSYYMRVMDNSTLRPMGHISDISAIGFKMDSAETLPIGQVFDLRLDLNEEIASKNFMVFSARTRWHGADRFDPYIQNIGFEIVRMAPQDAAIYQRIIEKYSA